MSLWGYLSHEDATHTFRNIKLLLAHRNQLLLISSQLSIPKSEKLCTFNNTWFTVSQAS